MARSRLRGPSRRARHPIPGSGAGDGRGVRAHGRGAADAARVLRLGRRGVVTEPRQEAAEAPQVSVTPSSGRRGSYPLDSTSPKRDEGIQRPWSFLAGLITKTLRVYGAGAVVGKALVAEDALGNVTFSATIPATTVALTGQTISQTATMIASASGEYLATVYLECTTAGAAGTLDFTFTHTDDVGARTTPIVASIILTGTNRDDGIALLRCSGGGIDYTATVTGAVGGPIFSFYIALVQVR